MKKKSLLEVALAVPRKSRMSHYTKEHLAVALAYARGEVNTHGVAAALNVANTNAVATCGAILVEAIRRGWIVESGK